MAERFLCSDPEAGDFAFADVEQILDALEAGVISGDTPLFDAARQSWQSVGFHSEVRAAWEARERYRPPGRSALALPPLPSVGAARDDEEPARPRVAFARVRSGSTALRVQAKPMRKRKLFAAAALLTLALLALVGLAIVTFAVRLTGFTAGLVTVRR
jgi:hypothetical protein